MQFSERYGFKPIRQSLQVESMDEGLRNGLWNSFYTHWYRPVGVEEHKSLKIIWLEFYKERVDIFDYERTRKKIEKTIQTDDWFKVYDLIEYCNLVLTKLGFTHECNRLLEREMSAYRFVDGRITPITTEIEIVAIEQATENGQSRWSPVTQHLRTALTLFSDRQQPDYRNSVKESISAVEAACQIITGNTKATLSDTLKTLEQEGQLHKALKEGFSKLYGYTSDAGGIRHALIDNTHTVTFNEAKFMLVTCSAFVNYLQPHLPDAVSSDQDQS